MSANVLTFTGTYLELLGWAIAAVLWNYSIFWFGRLHEQTRRERGAE